MATTYMRAAGGVIEASEVIGCKVENPMGEDLGKIEGLVVDLTEGRILYAVLSFGGFLGMGDKLYPIPLAAFSFRMDKGDQLDRCILNMDEETLKNAPSYERNRLPRTSDRSFITRIYSHYGYTPYWSE